MIALDCDTGSTDYIIISHFHLDPFRSLRCARVRYHTCPKWSFTPVPSGPIYMTHPTKAIAPILLGDKRKVVVETVHIGDRLTFRVRLGPLQNMGYDGITSKNIHRHTPSVTLHV